MEDLQRIVCAQLEWSCRERKAGFDCAEVDSGFRLHRPEMVHKDSPQPGVVLGLEMLPYLGRWGAAGGEIVLRSQNES